MGEMKNSNKISTEKKIEVMISHRTRNCRWGCRSKADLERKRVSRCGIDLFGRGLETLRSNSETKIMRINF
jgi:hypothetical protein